MAPPGRLFVFLDRVGLEPLLLGYEPVYQRGLFPTSLTNSIGQHLHQLGVRVPFIPSPAVESRRADGSVERIDTYGIPLLLIHGYPLGLTLWQPQVDGLTDIACVIAPDLRGFGQSDAPEGIYTMETHADGLFALLDALQVERAVVCGLSMG